MCFFLFFSGLSQALFLSSFSDCLPCPSMLKLMRRSLRTAPLPFLSTQMCFSVPPYQLPAPGPCSSLLPLERTAEKPREASVHPPAVAPKAFIRRLLSGAISWKSRRTRGEFPPALPPCLDFSPARESFPPKVTLPLPFVGTPRDTLAADSGYRPFRLYSYTLTHLYVGLSGWALRKRRALAPSALNPPDPSLFCACVYFPPCSCFWNDKAGAMFCFAFQLPPSGPPFRPFGLLLSLPLLFPPNPHRRLFLHITLM